MKNLILIPIIAFYALLFVACFKYLLIYFVSWTAFYELIQIVGALYIVTFPFRFLYDVIFRELNNDENDGKEN